MAKYSPYRPTRRRGSGPLESTIVGVVATLLVLLYLALSITLAAAPWVIAGLVLHLYGVI